MMLSRSISTLRIRYLYRYICIRYLYLRLDVFLSHIRRIVTVELVFCSVVFAKHNEILLLFSVIRCYSRDVRGRSHSCFLESLRTLWEEKSYNTVLVYSRSLSFVACIL